MKLIYNKRLNILARKLRKNSTLSEVLLWNQLKQRKMLEYQFLRQRPIGNYIVDFFCHELKLVIEIDGESHAEKKKKDRIRQNYLEEKGLTVIRFGDHAVKTEMVGVLNKIYNWISDKENLIKSPENPPNPL